MVPQPTQVRLVAYPSGIPADDVWSITHDSPPDRETTSSSSPEAVA
ncbi:hypothetical protein [Candidatus Poriferisocius sp.]